MSTDDHHFGRIADERKRRNYADFWVPSMTTEPFRVVLANIRDRLFITREVRWVRLVEKGRLGRVRLLWGGLGLKVQRHMQGGLRVEAVGAGAAGAQGTAVGAGAAGAQGTAVGAGAAGAQGTAGGAGAAGAQGTAVGAGAAGAQGTAGGAAAARAQGTAGGAGAAGAQGTAVAWHGQVAGPALLKPFALPRPAAVLQRFAPAAGLCCKATSRAAPCCVRPQHHCQSHHDRRPLLQNAVQNLSLLSSATPACLLDHERANVA
eukprot:364100-Chlamydomonas_euryale.AAC.72